MNLVTIVAYIIAIAVPVFTIYLFVMLDIFGTGKLSTILLCVGWGAVGAFLLAWTINNAVLNRGLAYETLTGGVAPTIEEILKSLILVYLVRQPRFRYIVDGAVYGIAVGIGFALSENLFIYLPGAGDAVLGTAISRTLSTSLMHATASGLVGISLGRLRRATSAGRNILPLLGIALAIGVHVLYNNLARQLEGIALLLVAIGIGLGGGVLIAWQISQGLADEKKRFAQTLGLNVGVSTGERKAVQQLGGTGIEQIFGELDEFFGGGNISQIRRLLVIQANIGILQNNLTGSQVSDRLRAAWEDEITTYREEIEQIRKALSAPVRLFLQSVFPGDDTAMQDALTEEIGRFDPTLVHTFDMFMRVSELAETFTPEQLAAMAERLHRIEIFKNVSLANLENLSRAISVQTTGDGQVLFDEGDEGDAMYLIEEGQIGIYVKDRTGQEKLLRTFQPGGVVGEFALLDGQPRSARAQASGQARVLALQREVFTMFIQSRPQVVLAMLQYLAEKVRYTTQSVEASVSWMTRIGQGDYQAITETSTGTAPAQGAAAVPDGSAAPVAGLEPADISEETPSLFESMFSRAAAALQQREDRIKSLSRIHLKPSRDSS
jgi:CRP-like cAMP-binding protein/RsiW-degrading membrane proteinase PrsW (M82 family)